MRTVVYVKCRDRSSIGNAHPGDVDWQPSTPMLAPRGSPYDCTRYREKSQCSEMIIVRKLRYPENRCGQGDHNERPEINENLGLGFFALILSCLMPTHSTRIGTLTIK